MNKFINRLDRAGLEQIGIAFEDSGTSREFEALIREEREVRVGEEISRGMSDELLEEFDSLPSGDDLARWLDQHCPDYGEIAAAVTQELKYELLQNRDRIPGLRPTPETRANGVELDKLDMGIMTRVRLRQMGISTFGEMAAMEDPDTLEDLKPKDTAEIDRVVSSAKRFGMKAVLKGGRFGYYDEYR